MRVPAIFMKVFVKNMRGQALMPCSPRKARVLLKQKKAKIVGYQPFTIQLCYATGEAKQDVVKNISENVSYGNDTGIPEVKPEVHSGDRFARDVAKEDICSFKKLLFEEKPDPNKLFLVAFIVFWLLLMFVGFAADQSHKQSAKENLLSDINQSKQYILYTVSSGTDKETQLEFILSSGYEPVCNFGSSVVLRKMK